MLCLDARDTRPPPSPGVPTVRCRVFLVSLAVVLTEPDKVPSEHVPWRKHVRADQDTSTLASGCKCYSERHAIVLAIEASAVPPLVLARGHRIEEVPEMPLVVSDAAEAVEKTSLALKVLIEVGALYDAEKAKDNHAIRPGKEKMRNHRCISRKGPLIVYGTEGAKLTKAFRNITGV